MVMLLEENNELLKLLITTIKNKDFNVDIEKMEKAISEKQMDRYRLIKLMGEVLKMNDWFKFIFKETIINLNNIPGVIFKDIEIGDVNVDNTSQK